MFGISEKKFEMSDNSGELTSSGELLRDKQIKALKSLTSLLVREVESIVEQQSFQRNGLPNQKIELYEEVQRFEAALIRNALILTGGVQRKAAKMLGVKVTTLNVKIKRHKIDIINAESVSG